MILKPKIEVTSSTRYLYENFLSFDSSDRAYIYARKRFKVFRVTGSLAVLIEYLTELVPLIVESKQLVNGRVLKIRGTYWKAQ